MSTSGFPILTKCTPPSLPISSLSFEFRISETYGYETQGGYIRTYALANCLPLFGLWGPQFPALCPNPGFQLLMTSIPSTQKLQNEINFFHISKSKDPNRPSEYFTLLYSIEYKCESKKSKLVEKIIFFINFKYSFLL